MLINCTLPGGRRRACFLSGSDKMDSLNPKKVSFL